MSDTSQKHRSHDSVPRSPTADAMAKQPSSCSESELRLDLQRLCPRPQRDDYEASFGLSESLHHETARYSMHLQNGDFSVINQYSSRTAIPQDALGQVINQFSSVKDQLLPVVDSDSEKSGIGEIRVIDGRVAGNSGSSQCERQIVQFDQSLMLCIVGAQNVGKTRLFAALTGRAAEERYKPTVAADFGVRVCNMARYLIFDSAGDTQFMSSAIAGCAAADIVLILYSSEKEAQFDHARLMYKKIGQLNNTACRVLVCAKSDAFETCAFQQRVEEFRRKNNIAFFSVSCVELFDSEAFLGKLSECYNSAPENVQNARKHAHEARIMRTQGHRQMLMANSAILSARSQSLIASSASSQMPPRPAAFAESGTAKPRSVIDK